MVGQVLPHRQDFLAAGDLTLQPDLPSLDPPLPGRRRGVGVAGRVKLQYPLTGIGAADAIAINPSLVHPTAPPLPMAVTL